MDRENDNTFLNTLRKLSKKGVYRTLEYIYDNEPLHYSDILQYSLENHVVQSRATVTLIVRGLLKMELIERTVLDTCPIRTVYRATEKGSRVLSLIHQMEDIVEPKRSIHKP